MRSRLAWLGVIGLFFASSSGCLTDFHPLPGDRTQAQDGSGAKVFGQEAAIEGVGATPDPYTVSQLVSYDNRWGDAPSPNSPVVIENAANDGFGAFSRDGLKNRDGSGTLNHKGVTADGQAMHVFRRSVLAIDTAPGCQGFDNIVRDYSGLSGAGVAVCFTGDAIELTDSTDLPLQDARGNKIESLDDLMSLLVRSRLNDGDTSMDLRLRKIVFQKSAIYFREPLVLNMGNARFFNFKLSSYGNEGALIQLISHLDRRNVNTGDWFQDFTLDFGDFRLTLPKKLNISFNMETMAIIDQTLKDRVARTGPTAVRRN
ncbi:MAG: hypothetical protein O7H41_11010 [Planctomycetota bacterium]|nr:hypothetical protein [Planctomycetota bacterium]